MDNIRAKLASRLAAIGNIGSDAEITALIETAITPIGFNNINEFAHYLTEGTLLNITKLASKCLAIPDGNYIVWTTPARTTILVPTPTIDTDIITTESPTHFEITTDKLLGVWNKVTRTIAESNLAHKIQHAARLMTECNIDPIVYITNNLEYSEDYLIEADVTPLDKPLVVASKALSKVADAAGSLVVQSNGRNLSLADWLDNIIKKLARMKAQLPDVAAQVQEGLRSDNLEMAQQADKTTGDSAEAATLLHKQLKQQQEIADKNPTTGLSDKTKRNQTLQRMGQIDWDPNNPQFQKLSGKLLGDQA